MTDPTEGPARISISLTEDHYRRLALLCYLGEWMVNAVRKEPDVAFEDTASLVYAAAHNTPAAPLAVFDDEAGAWEPSERLEDDAQALIDQYDEVTFWEELTARLTERDVMERLGERRYKGMRPQERERVARPVAKAYTEEFETNGLDRLGIDDQMPGAGS